MTALNGNNALSFHTLNTVQTVFKTKCAVPQSHTNAVAQLNALTNDFFNNYKNEALLWQKY